MVQAVPDGGGHVGHPLGIGEAVDADDQVEVAVHGAHAPRQGAEELNAQHALAVLHEVLRELNAPHPHERHVIDASLTDINDSYRILT